MSNLLNLPTHKLKNMEKSWNGDVSLPQEAKRLAQMSSDIRHFIMRSYVDPAEKQKIIDESSRKRRAALDIYEKIHSTFEFAHHEGTDKMLELKVIKIILVREGLLMSLSHLSEKASKQQVINGANLLELLSQIRESTLNYLEALIIWRRSSTRNDPQPRAFFWEGRNYTLKIIHDLDFLSKNTMVTEALSLAPEQLYLNPLMLNNNLEDFNTWMEPYDRAAMDTNGRVGDAEFEARLRLRFAERILLQEMETTDDGSDLFITQQERIMMDNQSTAHQPLVVGSNALENEYEYFEEPTPQLFRLPDERQVKSSGSASSSKAVGSLDPFSRGSAYSFGLSSAPTSSRAQSAPVQASEPLQPFEFGHDFFTGHWNQSAEEGREEGDDIAYLSTDLREDDHGVLFLENGEAVDGTRRLGTETIYRDDLQDGEPRDPPKDFDDRSVGSLAKSIRSIDSIGEMDVRALRAMGLPPRCVLLAASSCVILLSGNNDVPTDVSWKAFLRLAKKINLAEAMRTLDPLSVPTFKIIAIQSIVRQLLDDDAVNNVHNLNLPISTYTTVVKLIKWVQQFTTSAIKKQLKNKELGKGKIALEPIRSSTSKSNNCRLDATIDLLDRKAKPKSVPRTLELQTCHTELLKDLLPGHSLLLAVLVSPDAEPANEAKRIVLKLYEASSSKEVSVFVNIREYVLLQDELFQKYGEKVRVHFQPLDHHWWAQNAKHVLNVQLRSNGSLHASLSRRAIDEHVFKLLNSAPTSSTKLEVARQTKVNPHSALRSPAPSLDPRASEKPTSSASPSKHLPSKSAKKVTQAPGRASKPTKLVSSSLNCLGIGSAAKGAVDSVAVSQSVNNSSTSVARRSMDNSLLTTQPSPETNRPEPLAFQNDRALDDITTASPIPVAVTEATGATGASQAEAVQAEASQAEAVQAEAVQAEASQAEASQAEAVQAEAEAEVAAQDDGDYNQYETLLDEVDWVAHELADEHKEEAANAVPFGLEGVSPATIDAYLPEPASIVGDGNDIEEDDDVPAQSFSQNAHSTAHVTFPASRSIEEAKLEAELESTFEAILDRPGVTDMAAFVQGSYFSDFEQESSTLTEDPLPAMSALTLQPETDDKSSEYVDDAFEV